MAWPGRPMTRVVEVVPVPDPLEEGRLQGRAVDPAAATPQQGEPRPMTAGHRVDDREPGLQRRALVVVEQRVGEHRAEPARRSGRGGPTAGRGCPPAKASTASTTSGKRMTHGDSCGGGARAARGAPGPASGPRPVKARHEQPGHVVGGEDRGQHAERPQRRALGVDVGQHVALGPEARQRRDAGDGQPADQEGREGPRQERAQRRPSASGPARRRRPWMTEPAPRKSSAL